MFSDPIENTDIKVTKDSLSSITRVWAFFFVQTQLEFSFVIPLISLIKAFYTLA